MPKATLLRQGVSGALSDDVHRLLVDTETLGSVSPQLPDDAARHLKVLRPKVGEELELFDGCGSWRVFRVSNAAGRERGVSLTPVSEVFSLGRPARELVLFACVTKGSRWDWTVEKATELGVTRIIPVISDRTIVRIPKAERSAKRERWQRIAEDAARQSHAKWLPEIHEPTDFMDALGLVRDTECFVGALTNPPSPPLAQAIAASSGTAKPFAVFIGPEGDFTSEELALLMQIAKPTSFGLTILRAETAAIYAVSVVASMM